MNRNSSTTMHLLISNSYGTPNLGDEAILSAMCSYYLSLGHRVTIFSNGNYQPERPPPSGTVYVKAGPRRLLNTFQAIWKADLLVIGGGGIIQSSTSLGNLLFHLSRAWIAKLVNTPYVFVGVGVGPIPHKIGRVLTGWVFNQASYIGVRDRASIKLIKSMGVNQPISHSADLAYALGTSMAPCIQRGGVLRIGISLRPKVGSARNRLDSAGALELGKTLLTGIASVAKAIDRPIEVIFLSFNDEQDLPIGEKLVSLNHCSIPVSVRPATDTPGQRVELLSTMNLTISMRLHGIILSALALTPAIGIPYDPKVSLALEELGQGDSWIRPDVTHNEVERVLLDFIPTLGRREKILSEKVEVFRKKTCLAMRDAIND